MRIAMANALLPSTQQAGVPLQAHRLANNLVRRGHDVTMFTMSPSAPDCRYRVRTFPFIRPVHVQVYPFSQAAHLALTDFRGFDVIHCHGDNYLLWRWPSQVRTFHGSAKDEAKNARTIRRKAFYQVIIPLEALGARVARYNVAVSEATRRSISCIDEVVPNGVDLTQFRPGQKSAVPSILFVGGLQGRKRGSLLVTLFMTHIRQHVPQAELWVVSPDSVEGEGIVSFGRVSDDVLARLFRKAWVFASPSSYEGFGVPYIEAMAAGTAVVATANAGALEVLQCGKYGIVSDDEKFGENIVMLLERENARQRLAEGGLRRAAVYDWDAVCASYERIYQRVRVAPNKVQNSGSD